MTYTNKLAAGSPFPDISATNIDDNTVQLKVPQGSATWQMVVVYRGKHCPLCTKYLNNLEGYIARLADIGISVIAVSGDSKAQLEAHKEKLNVTFPLLYGLTEVQMKELGLYISIPRSEKETDHNFAEPGLFVINEAGTVQVADVSNNPFTRPELEALVNGLAWIRNPDNNYPIRGTLAY
ncbi:peroxiredoxin family protein [Parasalinivibrio latis]|uniref:peroxiredoxin family protein n=1 Tax=Parasalinivibrio latis TaxID=2952610 RepID=UPI0030E3886A